MRLVLRERRGISLEKARQHRHAGVRDGLFRGKSEEQTLRRPAGIRLQGFDALQKEEHEGIGSQVAGTGS